MALIDKLSAIGEAIREKTGKEELLTLDQMATEISRIETGGLDFSVGLLDGTLTEYKNDKVTRLRTYAFYYNSAIKRVILPSMTGICNDNSFRNCTSLEFFDAPCSKLSTTCFAGCSALKTLVLRKIDSTCTLLSVNSFTSTPFAEGGSGGAVYVPSALIESYKTETNWSALYEAGTCNFIAIEGSEYE